MVDSEIRKGEKEKMDENIGKIMEELIKEGVKILKEEIEKGKRKR